MPECTFTRSTATIAAWNLAGFGGIPDARLEKQVEGLRLLDSELVTLVEISSQQALTKLQEGLREGGLEYGSLFLPQQSDLHIGLLFKTGVVVENASLLDGSDLGDPAKRKALVAEVKIGKFDFTLIAVHLKSGREKANQEIRDDQCQVISQHITDLRGPMTATPTSC